MWQKKYKTFEVYLRNIVFGVEDSLVSTVGFLSGIAVANIPQKSLLLTGFVLISVEAFSMGVGSFLSEHSVDEYENHHTTRLKKAILAGVVMFVSYFFSGFIPLTPYILLPSRLAFGFSIFVSLIALFILGIFTARWIKRSMIIHGIEMVILGGLAIFMGMVVGNIMQ